MYGQLIGDGAYRLMPKKSADPEIIANSSSVNVGSLKVDLVGGEKLDVNDGDVDWSEDYAWDGRGYWVCLYLIFVIFPRDKSQVWVWQFVKGAKHNNDANDLDSGKPCAALLASIFSRITGG